MILFCKNKQISREDGRKNCFSRDNSMVIKVKLSFQLGLSNCEFNLQMQSNPKNLFGFIRFQNRFLLVNHTLMIHLK